MPKSSKVNPQLALIESPELEAPELKAWALVELFGHQRIVGYLSQQTFGMGVLFRVDVPDLLKDGRVIREGFTRYFGLPHIDGTPARPMSLGSYGEGYS
jgi:hypothetical protein